MKKRASRMSFETKYKILLHKTYFEQGYGLTQYVKYFVLLFGVTTANLKLSLAFFGLYGIACYIIGWLWYHSEFVLAAAEISNRFNPFVDEVRRHINGKRPANR